MRVDENFTVRKNIIDALRFKSSKRSGWHVTELIACPRKSYWLRSGIVAEYEDSTILTFTRGRSYHDILEVYDVKEKSINKDGIYGSIDTVGERITEIFTTMLGSKNDYTAFPMKISQLMAYCYIEGKLEGDLVIFHLQGDYTRPIKPELKCYTISFEPIELSVLWDLLLRRKKEIEEGRKIGIPPLSKGEPFECNNCKYDYLCKAIDGYMITLGEGDLT